MRKLPERLRNNEFEVIRCEIKEVIEKRYRFLKEKARMMKAKLVAKKVVLRQSIINLREEIKKIRQLNVTQNVLKFIDSTALNIKILTKRKKQQ